MRAMKKHPSGARSSALGEPILEEAPADRTTAGTITHRSAEAAEGRKAWLAKDFGFA
jgi:hypothetical protein